MSELMVLNAKSVTPAAYGVDEDAIRREAESFGALTIKGEDDKAGYKAVHEARMKLKNVRVDIEKKRKELKEGSLAFGRAVDSVAKQLTALVEPTERLLESRQAEIDNLAKQRAKERLDNRMRLLAEVEYLPIPSFVEALTDDGFAKLLDEQKKLHAEKVAQRHREEAERKRLEAEAIEAKRLEDERIAEEKRRLEEDRRKLEAERAEMDRKAEEERKRREAERAEDERKIREQQAAIQKLEAERAERELIERERVEAAEREKRERIAAEEAKRIAAEQAALKEKRRPDREKIIAYLNSLQDVNDPEVSDAAEETLQEIFGLFDDFFSRAMAIAKAL